MSDLREAFKSKDFVINTNIIKNISSLDINLKEFLLILYFINVSPFLDTDDIEEKIGLSTDEITEIFGSLLSKKYIELDVTNKKGEIIEQIKLDPLYDRLALNKKIDKTEGSNDIFKTFEQEFGRALSPMEFEMINKWINLGNEEETIKEALKEAVLNNVRNFKYIDKILYDWSKKGIKNRIKEENKQELFDYNWLDENE